MSDLRVYAQNNHIEDFTIAMIRFLYPQFFLLFIPIALLGVFSFFRILRLRKSLTKFGDTRLVKDLMPDLSLKRKVVKDILILSTLTFMTLAMARPQMGSKVETIKKEGIEIIICMDISNSMLSDDVKPSRLERAKGIVSKLVDNLRNDKVGLVLFAGDAFVQLPITADFVSAKMFLSTATPDLIESQGTAIGKAVTLATRSFSRDNTVKKAILLITDGENHEDDALKAVKEANSMGIMVNVIGVGTPQGGPIPIGGDEKYLMDESGQMVITKINEAMGQEIAQAGGGVYVLANDISTTTSIVTKELDKVEKAELETRTYSSYDEKYYYFLIPALLLLLLDLLYLGRKNRYLRGLKLFGE